MSGASETWTRVEHVDGETVLTSSVAVASRRAFTVERDTLVRLLREAGYAPDVERDGATMDEQETPRVTVAGCPVCWDLVSAACNACGRDERHRGDVDDVTALRRAISDPGHVLPRETPPSGQLEGVPHWSARAVLALGFRRDNPGRLSGAEQGVALVSDDAAAWLAGARQAAADNTPCPECGGDRLRPDFVDPTRCHVPREPRP